MPHKLTDDQLVLIQFGAIRHQAIIQALLTNINDAKMHLLQDNFQTSSLSRKEFG